MGQAQILGTILRAVYVTTEPSSTDPQVRPDEVLAGKVETPDSTDLEGHPVIRILCLGVVPDVGDACPAVRAFEPASAELDSRRCAEVGHRVAYPVAAVALAAGHIAVLDNPSSDIA